MCVCIMCGRERESKCVCVCIECVRFSSIGAEQVNSRFIMTNTWFRTTLTTNLPNIFFCGIFNVLTGPKLTFTDWGLLPPYLSDRQRANQSYYRLKLLINLNAVTFEGETGGFSFPTPFSPIEVIAHPFRTIKQTHTLKTSCVYSLTYNFCYENVTVL